MSIKTSIQWCDSTINFVMGCSGCELFPTVAKIFSKIIEVLDRDGVRVGQGELMRVFTSRIEQLQADAGVDRATIQAEFYTANTSNLYVARTDFSNAIADLVGVPSVAHTIQSAIEAQIKCYAAKLHLMRRFDIRNPTKHTNRGYAKLFEGHEVFADRIETVAKWPDLKNIARPDKPSIDAQQSRMVFVSDMGDAMSEEFFSVCETAVNIFSTTGGKHLYLWLTVIWRSFEAPNDRLTKRPATMAKFGRLIGQFPRNVCVMTSVTGKDSIYHIQELKNVPASIRGLSVEPPFEKLPELNLEGIDWLIVGGESGARKNVSAFHCEWALDLRRQCQQQNVSFFLKQLGSRPVDRGQELQLSDKHGGDWSEWPDELSTRNFPAHFVLEPRLDS